VSLVLLTLIRWLHAVAATVWVGGALFYIFALNPALAELAPSDVRRALSRSVGQHFQEASQVAVAIIFLTGAVISVDRLSQPHLNRAYAVVLFSKIVLAVTMVLLAATLGSPRRATQAKPRPAWLTAPYLIMFLGLAVYLLAIVLQVLFDMSYGAVS
jgi:putative copper export protein